MNLSRFRIPAIWTCSILWLITLCHLVGVYIYESGSVIGVSGGSINIGMVGESPNIPNPIEFGKNKQHDLILGFLFRSLIRYNNETGIYQGDIANCDLTDLSKVTCALSGSGKWSDDTDIKVDDIIATYQAFRESGTNDKMKAFLGKVAVVSKDGATIEISADEKNSLMLDLLTYPILRSDMIERIRTDRMGKDAYVTSGAYTFLENEKNEQYGYSRVTLEKNPNAKSKSWLDKYNFLFFSDMGSLERAGEILSIIVPENNAGGLILGPRFETYDYTTYEYIGLFLNTDTISNAVRKHVLLQARSWLSGSAEANEKPIEMMFHSEENIPVKLEKNLWDILREWSYRKVEDRLASLENENGMMTWSAIDYGNTVYFDTPSRKKIIFNEEAVWVITLSGNVPTGISSVIVNGYALKEYVAGNNRFTYKVSLTDGTLLEGKNTYTLEFETTEGVRNQRDILTVYYHRDATKMAESRWAVEAEYLAKLNTPELVAGRLAKVTEEKTKLGTLDPRYYYNNKYEPFELDLMYLSDPRSLEVYATKLASTLLGIGLKVNITSISTKDFSAMLQKWEKNYDLLIVGFEANGRFSRIGQIFLSSEAKTGINFAKIESKTLDGLFASLRISYAEGQTEEILKKISEFMKSEAFFLPISSPLHTIYVDRSLKGIKKIPLFQDITSLYSVVEKASIKEEYILNLEGKSFSGFFSWISLKIGL